MNPLVFLAKLAVEGYVKEDKIIETPENLPEKFLKKRAGAFVTIEKEGKLRGCIGTYLPTKTNIAEEVIYNAIAAAVRDSRFKPIKIEELPRFSYTVYILNKPEPVENLNSLDPKKFGLIVKTMPFPSEQKKQENSAPVAAPPKTGLLLPDIDGVDTVEKQIAIACQKGGIDPAKEKIFIYRFTVEKYQ